MMKSERERAEQAIEAVRGAHGKDTLAVVEHILREHARDQQHLCAEAVNGCGGEHATMDKARAAVLNAPAPGNPRIPKEPAK